MRLKKTLKMLIAVYAAAIIAGCGKENPEQHPDTTDQTCWEIKEAYEYDSILVGKHVFFSTEWIDIFNVVRDSLYPGISDEELASRFETWRDRMDSVYECYTDLTGEPTDPKSYNGKIYIHVGDDLAPNTDAHAHPTHSMVCYSDYTARWEASNVLKYKENWCYMIMHEMGHIFDNGKPWRFDHESLADLKYFYALDNIGAKTYTCCTCEWPYGPEEGGCHKGYLENLNSFWKGEATENYFGFNHNAGAGWFSAYYNYNYSCIEFAGWDAIKAAFRKFNGGKYTGQAYKQITGREYDLPLSPYPSANYSPPYKKSTPQDLALAATFYNEVALADGRGKDLFKLFYDQGSTLVAVEEEMKANTRSVRSTQIRTPEIVGDNFGYSQSNIISTPNDEKGFLIIDNSSNNPSKSKFNVDNSQTAEALSDKYSEGSKELKSLLLNLWRHRLETISSCSAIKNFHESRDYENLSPPHIAFIINSENKDRIANMVSNFTQEDLAVFDVIVRSDKGTNVGETILFEWHDPKLRKMISTQDSDNIFKKFGELFERTLDKKTLESQKLPAAVSLAKFISNLPNEKYPYYVKLKYNGGAVRLEVRVAKQNAKLLENLNNNDLKNIDNVILGVINR